MTKKEMTLEELMGMPLEELAAMPGVDTVDAKPADTSWIEKAVGLDPRRSALPNGLVGPLGKAMETVYCDRGEHVTENAVSRYGLCRLRVMKLGSAVTAQLYLDQIYARVGVSGLHAWAWTEKSAGQTVHVMLFVWKQD